MTKAESGRLGGMETLIKYGPQRCPHCGHLAEKSEFHASNGRKGGLKGSRTLQLRYSREQRQAWSKLGGRPRREKAQ
jgi:hypothetical protein